MKRLALVLAFIFSVAGGMVANAGHDWWGQIPPCC